VTRCGGCNAPLGPERHVCVGIDTWPENDTTRVYDAIRFAYCKRSLVAVALEMLTLGLVGGGR